MNSRMARVKAMQLSVIAQTFFAFLDDLHCKRIRLMQEDTIQYAENIRKISSSLDTFWFDTALRENLSPAALVLRLPSFLKDAGLGIDDVSPSEQKILQHTEAPESSSSEVSPSQCQPCAVQHIESLLPPAPQTEIRIRRNTLTPQKGSVVHETKVTLPSLEEAADSYIAAKKLTWSSASA